MHLLDALINDYSDKHCIDPKVYLIILYQIKIPQSAISRETNFNLIETYKQFKYKITAKTVQG